MRYPFRLHITKAIDEKWLFNEVKYTPSGKMVVSTYNVSTPQIERWDAFVASQYENRVMHQIRLHAAIAGLALLEIPVVRWRSVPHVFSQ